MELHQNIYKQKATFNSCNKISSPVLLHEKSCLQSSRLDVLSAWNFTNLQENTHAEVWFHHSAWVFSCKFAAYFQNTFSWKHLWVAASEKKNFVFPSK